MERQRVNGSFRRTSEALRHPKGFQAVKYQIFVKPQIDQDLDTWEYLD